jgi:hypothetical protein
VTSLVLSVLTSLLLAGAPVEAAGTEGVRAPPGYEPFCFPYGFDFEEGTATMTSLSRERLAVVVDMHYGRYDWLNLVVGVETTDPEEFGRKLARQRTEAILGELGRLGIAPDRVQVKMDASFIESDYGLRTAATTPTVQAAWLTAMIPPEEVKRVRAEEAKGVIFC